MSCCLPFPIRPCSKLTERAVLRAGKTNCGGVSSRALSTTGGREAWPCGTVIRQARAFWEMGRARCAPVLGSLLAKHDPPTVWLLYVLPPNVSCSPVHKRLLRVPRRSSYRGGSRLVPHRTARRQEGAANENLSATTSSPGKSTHGNRVHFAGDPSPAPEERKQNPLPVRVTQGGGACMRSQGGGTGAKECHGCISAQVSGTHPFSTFMAGCALIPIPAPPG